MSLAQGFLDESKPKKKKKKKRDKTSQGYFFSVRERKMRAIKVSHAKLRRLSLSTTTHIREREER